MLSWKGTKLWIGTWVMSRRRACISIKLLYFFDNLFSYIKICMRNDWNHSQSIALTYLCCCCCCCFSRVRLFATPWTRAHQASLSITNSRSPPRPMSIKSMMPSNHLILWHPLLLLPSIFPSIRVFSNKSALQMRWSKYWSFSFIKSSGISRVELSWGGQAL